MKSFNEWKTEDSYSLKPMPNKNKEGGFDPKTKEQKSIFKKADLITLPLTIEGTNCSNCKFVNITDKKEGIGFCMHKEVLQWVTKRNCCAFWDNTEVKRKF